MSFQEKLPEWHNEGIEPPDSKKQTGWEVLDKPPAGWLNWFFTRISKSVKELREKSVTTEQMEEALSNINTDVIDSTTSTDKTKAGSANSVRQALVDAKTYADDNFIKPSQELMPNFIKNSSGHLGLQGWTPAGESKGSWRSAGDISSIGSHFETLASIPTGFGSYLDSDPITVLAGNNYQLQAMFHTSGTTSERVAVEIINVDKTTTYGQIEADLNTWWHRKVGTFQIPTGVTQIRIRLTVVGTANTQVKAFSRVKLALVYGGALDNPYSNEGDILSVINYTTETAPNLIKNSTGMLGLRNWTNISTTNGTWDYVNQDSTMGSLFYTSSTSATNHMLDSELISIGAGGTYSIQAMFAIAGITSGLVRVQVINAAKNAVFATLTADLNTGWHRKITTFTIPEGNAAVYVRLLQQGTNAGNKHYARIKLARTSKDTPYTNEADTFAIRQELNGKPDELITANLVKNSSGAFGLQNWTTIQSPSGPWAVYPTSETVGSFFTMDRAIPAGSYAVLAGDEIPVVPGMRYKLQCVFYSQGVTVDNHIYIDVRNLSANTLFDTLPADTNKRWHRKSKTITIPAGCTKIRIELVTGGLSAIPEVPKAFSRIKLSELPAPNGSTFIDEDVPYSQEGDFAALFQSGVSAKQAIVDAINAMGGSASTNDTWATLAAKVQTLSRYQRVIPNINRSNTIMPVGHGYVDIASIPAGTKFITVSGVDYSGQLYLQANNGNGYIEIVLEDDGGRSWIIANTGWGQSLSFASLTLDVQAARASYVYSNTGGTQSVSNSQPAGFNKNGTFKLRFHTYADVSGVYHTLRSIQMAVISG